MVEYLIEIDHQLFTFLNSFHADWLDPIMKFISGKLTWLPLYLFLLYLIIRQYGKKVLLIIGVVIVLITASDQLSQAFKYGFKRYRPCQELSSHAPKPHIVDNKCGGFYGFYSAHSSNSFAIAFFLGSLLLPLYRQARVLLLFWAGVVAYSRVYLGVHYPADITVGAIFGVALGWLFQFFYFKVEERLYKSN